MHGKVESEWRGKTLWFFNGCVYFWGDNLDIGGVKCPLSGSTCFVHIFSGSTWFRYPTSGIHVGWLPYFRDPRGLATPLSGSRWYGYPNSHIHVKNHQNGGAKVQYSKLPLVLVVWLMLRCRCKPMRLDDSFVGNVHTSIWGASNPLHILHSTIIW